jgi:hypothetical protein
MIVHDVLNDIICRNSHDAIEHGLCFMPMLEAAYEGNNEHLLYLKHR